jgi:hypothetical protein
MLRFFKVLVMVVSVLMLAPVRAAAQNQNRPLSALLPQLYLDTISNEVAAFLTVLPQQGIPVDVNALLDAGVRRLSEAGQIIGLAGNQLSSFPLASPSGGFTWVFDASSGAVTRATNSFGPIFAERPLTIGRRRLNVGANLQHVTFDHLEGRSLSGGEIVGYLSVPLPGGDHIFFADSLDLKVTTDTLNMFATYGLTDRLDVGVAVPINRVDLHATLSSRIGTTSIGIIDSDPIVVNSQSGAASGIGDMVIRAKYNMLKGNAVGVAESIDVRVPTGDELNLLGIAGPQVKLTFIASSALGQLSPHANLAYTISGTSAAAEDPENYVIAPPEEINYAAGADWAASLRTTVAADVVGRVMRKVGTLTWGPSDFGGSQYQQFHLSPGEDLNLLLGSVGVKVNPFRNMLVTANVLFPLTRSGLTARLTWMAGVDYSF